MPPAGTAEHGRCLPYFLRAVQRARRPQAAGRPRQLAADATRMYDSDCSPDRRTPKRCQGQRLGGPVAPGSRPGTHSAGPARGGACCGLHAHSALTKQALRGHNHPARPASGTPGQPGTAALLGSVCRARLLHVWARDSGVGIQPRIPAPRLLAGVRERAGRPVVAEALGAGDDLRAAAKLLRCALLPNRRRPSAPKHSKLLAALGEAASRPAQGSQAAPSCKKRESQTSGTAGSRRRRGLCRSLAPARARTGGQAGRGHLLARNSGARRPRAYLVGLHAREAHRQGRGHGHSGRSAGRTAGLQLALRGHAATRPCHAGARELGGCRAPGKLASRRTPPPQEQSLHTPVQDCSCVFTSASMSLPLHLR